MLIILDLWKVLKCVYQTFISIALSCHSIWSHAFQLFDQCTLALVHLLLQIYNLTCHILAVRTLVMTEIIKHRKLCSFVIIIPFHIVKHHIVRNSNISNAISNMFKVYLSYSFAENIGLY
jgi:hypothetical protein